MHERTREVLRRALHVALEHGAVSTAEYEAARQALASRSTTEGSDDLPMGGYALVEFLYACAIEDGETPPKCAQEWREVETALAECRPEDHERLSALQARSHELAAECHAAARRWWHRHDGDAHRTGAG